MSEPSTASVPMTQLADGRAMPQLGYGVWQVPDADAEALVARAIELGYRSIDTATIYENEAGVGRGIAASGIPRDELFVTTKLWNTEHQRAAASAALDRSLELLGMDSVDLYLIHWPSPARGMYAEAWHALVDAHEDGRARSIGVSNFGADNLARIIDGSGVVPVVNQVELHPYFQQRELREVHAEHGIATEAWSPLGQGGELLADPVLVDIAGRHGCSPAQVVLAWHLAIGNVTIPKSATPTRIAENLASVDVALEAEDLQRITDLDQGDAGRIGPNPATAQF